MHVCNRFNDLLGAGPLIITDNGLIFPLDFVDEEDDDDPPPPPLIHAPVDEDFDWGTITPSNIPPPDEELSWDYVIQATAKNNTSDDWSPAEEDSTVNWSEPTEPETHVGFVEENINEEARLQVWLEETGE